MTKGKREDGGLEREFKLKERESRRVRGALSVICFDMYRLETCPLYMCLLECVRRVQIATDGD